MSADLEGERPLPNRGLPTLVYVVSFLGACYIWMVYRPHGALLALSIAVPVLALAWVLRACFLHRRIAGPASPAQRAYLRRFVPLMILYVACLFAAIRVNQMMAPNGILAVALAILPSLPLIGVVWSIFRLVTDETDEYQRSLVVRQILIATGLMLAVSCVWGFLETFGQVPHVPMYWAFIIWCAGLGVGSFVNEFKS
jgi:hypothetical protein